MNKRFVFIIASTFFYYSSFAQKPVVDISAKFPGVGAAYLTNNGEYVYYISYDEKGNRVSIEGTHNAWKKEINAINGQVSFANEGHLLITKCGEDSLCLQTLESDQQEFIPHVGSFNVSKTGKAEWLIYQLSSPGKELVLRNLATGKQQSFSNIANYQFSTGDRAVVLQQQVGDSSSLGWLNLDKGILIPIWQGKSHGDLRFGSDGKTVAFISSSDMPGKKALWYYKTGDEKASILITENTADDLTQGFRLGHLIGLNNTGDKLFFTLQPIINKSDKTPDPNLVSVDIYSYKDLKLQSQQLKESQKAPPQYTYVFNLSSHKLIPLEQEKEHLLRQIQGAAKQDFVLVRTDNGGDEFNEWNWNPAALNSICLVSTIDGTRKCLVKNLPDPATGSYRLSPDDKYVVYYDAVLRDYCSYNIASGVTRNITKGAGADWIGEYQEDWPDSSYWVEPDIQWAVNEEAVFINNKNDIYQADPSGKRPVIRLTGNYGRIHHFQFSFAKLYWSAAMEIDPEGPLLLKALNEETRDEGYCKVMAGRENKPELLKMMPYDLDLLQKARDAEVYTVQLESAEKSPNQFLTADFKTFTPLTDNYPEKAYNWMTSELVHFKTLDGKNTQGILFKPENFDPKKKYPVIFEYYERYIAGLHKFAYPDYSDAARIDIPTYVSNGYLVFTPDIHYKVGYPGRSAYNSILAAAHYLAQFPWVDKGHMGLMGHSFGGFETNYVITHSHLFAAAVSMSGMTDFVSAYGSIIGDGTSRQRQYELYRDRIGATLWQRPDLYLENSPVLKTDQVTTPVLLMANKKDDDVPYQQGVEFFTALRRLGKKAWMLQYDNGDHQVFEPTDRKDLTIRMAQFFDYFLKGAHPPKWMTIGVPASLKRIDTGLEIDGSGIQP
jgi:dipeptidyl aminopeptidase/acylaminoacyl peptidase